DKKLDLTSAVQVALSEIVGACAMMVYSQSEKLLVAVNRGGQLFAGVNGSECFVASDKNAFAGYSKNFFEIGNNQFLLVRSGKEPKLLNFNLEVLKPEIEELDVDINQLTKGDYPNFMLKEIHEQPEIMRQGMTGRINFKTQEICFGGLDEYWEQIKQASSLVIVACGTSFHAGLLAKYWLEKLVNIPVKVEYASEFQAATIKAGDIVLGISQSGTTADTIVALEAAKDQGAITLGVCNVVNSKMARLVNAGIYTRAGVENGVASTKAFTAQALALLLFALKLANDKKTISNFNLRIINQLESLPNLMEQALGSEKVIRTLARKLKQTTNCLFLGRGYSFPVALEGALKLKEISYVHAEGLPAGESKHGPL
ncbi:glutamine--fructose-6-phosphate aminotransferase, partial [Candidatus Falkowbacteria bacterium CG_4_10_14_0_2_um_filter_41_15]